MNDDLAAMGEKKRHTVFKIIVLATGGAFLIFGAYLFWGSIKIFSRFDEWAKARPVDMEVDFSKTGKYESRFEQTCSSSHGEIIGLQVPESAISNSNMKILLKGLDADCVITESNGVEIVSVDLPAEGVEWGEPCFGNLISLEKIHPFRKGTYKISVSVLEAAPSLTGIEQRLVARYELCGLERMPGVVLRLASYVCFVIGGVFVLITLWIFAKSGRKVNENL